MVSVLPKDRQARVGYELIKGAFGPGGPGPLQVVVPAGTDPASVARTVTSTAGVAAA